MMQWFYHQQDNDLIWRCYQQIKYWFCYMESIISFVQKNHVLAKNNFRSVTFYIEYWNDPFVQKVWRLSHKGGEENKKNQKKGMTKRGKRKSERRMDSYFTHALFLNLLPLPLIHSLLYQLGRYSLSLGQANYRFG